MPYVIEDMGSGNFDLTVTTSADWTTHSADMPNGDNAMSLVTALNQNAFWSGEEFCLPNGSGSEARTLEFWLNSSNQTTTRTVAIVRTNGTATTGTSRHWNVVFSTSETLQVNWFTTSGGATTTPSVSLATGWRYVVIVFQCGASKSITVYVDTVSVASIGVSGTPTYATSDTYEFYLGSSRTNSTEEVLDHLAKVAWYSRALDSGEISDHYLAMTGA